MLSLLYNLPTLVLELDRFLLSRRLPRVLPIGECHRQLPISPHLGPMETETGLSRLFTCPTHNHCLIPPCSTHHRLWSFVTLILRGCFLLFLKGSHRVRLPYFPTPPLPFRSAGCCVFWSCAVFRAFNCYICASLVSNCIFNLPCNSYSVSFSEHNQLNLIFHSILWSLSSGKTNTRTRCKQH